MTSTKLDLVYVSLLAALGLACADRPAGSDTETGTSTATATSTSGDGDGDTTTTTTTSGDGDGDMTTSGDGDGDMTTSGDGDGDPEPFACLDPVEIMQADTEVPSGFVMCAGGFIHRTEAVECVNPQQADDPSCEDGFGSCTSAADCMEGAHGSCHAGLFDECSCTYGCVSDADCGEGYACVCAGVFSPLTQCVPADCLDDATCGEGLCGVSLYQDICEDSYSLACAGPTDECHSDDECEVALCNPRFPDGPEAPFHCTAAGGEGFTCEAPGWCTGDCGRPFIVDGQARVARAVQRRAWARRSLAPRTVDPDTAARLAAHWTRVGQFEHASVASFARFVAQLLALAAPPELVRATQAAMVDEVEHARLAFGLASAYAEVELGPGPLDLDHGLDPLDDPRAILAGLIDEACIGETLAALEADASAEQARDPAVAAVLERIASDELRHAQLGWRCLAWMLERDPELRRFALDRLDAAIVAAREAALGELAAADPAQPPLAGFGLASPATAARHRLAALRHVVEPCVARLRDAPAPRRPTLAMDTAR